MATSLPLPKPACWICGDVGTSGEHLIKLSDLKSLYGHVTQAKPILMHENGKLNREVPGLKAKVLKSNALLCAYCNNTRTQPHDKAWEQFSRVMRAIGPDGTSTGSVRANRVFPMHTANQMINIHLYFLKVLGCMIEEHSVPITIGPVAASIMSGKPHPNVYLKFYWQTPLAGIVGYAGRSHMEVKTRASDGECLAAGVYYSVGRLSVQILYNLPTHPIDGLENAWHPRNGAKKLTFGHY